MSQKFNKLIIESAPNQDKANQLVGRLFEVTQPGAVYSQPVTQGEYTVITASEVSIAMGTGYGGGGSIGGPQAGEDGNSEESGGVGGGGGGGGTAMARPVALISIGPDGVRMEPIMDPTKIALAFFTTMGAMVMACRKMCRSK